MILEFSEFIRAKYPYIIIATLVVAIFVGFYTASPGKDSMRRNGDGLDWIAQR